MNWIYLIDIIVILGSIFAWLIVHNQIIRLVILIFSGSFLALYGLPTGTNYDFDLALMHLIFLVSFVLVMNIMMTSKLCTDRWIVRILPPTNIWVIVTIIILIIFACGYLLIFRHNQIGTWEDTVLGMRGVRLQNDIHLSYQDVVFFNAFKQIGGMGLALAIYLLNHTSYRKLACLLITGITLTYGVQIILGGGRSGPPTFFALIVCSVIIFNPRLTLQHIGGFLVGGIICFALAAMVASNRTQGIKFSDLPKSIVSSINVSEFQSLHEGVNENVSILLVYENIPDKLDLLWGYSLYTILVNPIPRIIWPEKPVGYGKLLTYELLGNNPIHDTGFSISTGIMGEGYANFCWPGVVFAGIGMGIYMALCTNLLLIGNKLPYAGAIGVHMLSFVHPMLRGDWLTCMNHWFYPLVTFFILTRCLSLVLNTRRLSYDAI